MKKLTTLVLTAALVALTPVAAFADSDSSKSSSKSSSSEQATPALESILNSSDSQQEKKTQIAPDTLAAIKARAAEAIAKRQRDLASWTAKVTSQTTDCGQNAASLTRIGAAQAGLVTLGTSLAAATTPEAAKPLYQQIFTHQRVYLVVSPAVNVAIACDKQWARGAKQTTTIAELTTKITAAKAKGINTAAAEALLAQVAPVIATGKTTSAAAAASLTGLAADQGVEATKAANAAAVDAAKAQIKLADASFDKAADLLKQTAKALGTDSKDHHESEKAKREAERAKEKAEREAEKAKREAERAKDKAEREEARNSRSKGKSGK